MTKLTRRSFARMASFGALGTTPLLAACGNGVGSRGAEKIDARVDSTLNYLYNTYPNTREIEAKSVGQLVMPLITEGGFIVGGGFGRGAGGPGAAQATVIQTRPTSRTSYQFRYQNGTLTATRATPNLQRSLMELHKGHGPSLFTTYQKLVALALILVVLSGVWMGLASKVLRKKTGLVSLAGLVVFILAGFVI